jgi:basic amino acid/polyamine antiporter, APA family
MATTTAPSEGALYSRKATGLVRQLSAFDAFVLCFSAVAVPIGMTQAFLFAPQLFPGVNMTISFLVAAVAALFFGLVYMFFTQLMPRSGGDYVWLSRIVHPSVGFTVGAVSTFTPLQFASLNLAIQTTIFLPALADLLGTKNFAMSKGTQFAVAIGATLVIGALLLVGVRWIARIASALFLFVALGVIVWLALLLFGSHDEFRQTFDAQSPQSYQQVIDAASRGGFDTSASAKSTLLGIVFGFQFFVGFQWLAYFAGEVRQASRTARIAIVGTWALTAFTFVTASVLVYRYYGFEFLSAAGQLFTNEPDAYKVPVPPYLSSLIPYLTSSTFLQYFIVLSFVASIVWSALTFMLVASRNFFAWSYDRVVPEWISRVSPRFRSPVYAIATTVVLVLILDYLTVYTAFWGLLVNWVAVMAAAFFVVSATLVMLPRLRPDIWARAPEELKRRWFGALKVQVVGVIAGLFELAILIIALSTPSIGGGVTIKSLVYAFAVPVLAFAYFWINRRVRRGQGVNMDRNFAEIPSD